MLLRGMPEDRTGQTVALPVTLPGIQRGVLLFPK